MAETDAQAREEFEEHLWYFKRRLLEGINWSPPGYTSTRSMLALLQSVGSFMLEVDTWEQIEKGSYAIVGSPETVLDKLSHHIEELGVGYLLGLFQLGSLPDHLARRNLALFAEQVMPKLKERFPDPAEEVVPVVPDFAEAVAAAGA